MNFCLLPVTITRFESADQPGWVVCEFTDASQTTHQFIEKVSVVTTLDLDESSSYPEPILLECRLCSVSRAPDGRRLAVIDLDHPYHISTEADESRFTVMADSLAMVPDCRCRVCGYLHSDFVWGATDTDPSWEICDCCGTTFGYEDCSRESASSARQRWISSGAVWFSPNARPSDWNLQNQLSQIPVAFADPP